MTDRAPEFIGMERRALVTEIWKHNQSSPLIAMTAEMQRQQIDAAEALRESSTRQADEMIRLTGRITWLTWILVAVGVVQLLWLALR